MREWIKTWTRVNHDPTYGGLTWAQRGILQALELLAAELGPKVNEGTGNGHLDTLERVAYWIRCDLSILEPAVEALQAADLIHEQDGLLCLTHWTEQQKVKPSELPEATRERKRAQRERERKRELETAGVEACDVTSVTRDVTPVTPQEERRKEEREKRQKHTSTHETLSSETSELESEKALVRAALEIRDMSENRSSRGPTTSRCCSWARSTGARPLWMPAGLHGLPAQRTLEPTCRLSFRTGPRAPIRLADSWASARKPSFPQPIAKVSDNGHCR